jgi:hypothetical protein
MLPEEQYGRGNEAGKEPPEESPNEEHTDYGDRDSLSLQEFHDHENDEDSKQKLLHRLPAFFHFCQQNQSNQKRKRYQNVRSMYGQIS